MNPAQGAEGPGEQVGRSYTRARRYPLVIGKLPGGGRIFGGPYTLSQIGVMVGAVLALYLTTPLWAHLGYGNGAVYAIAPYGLSWTVRHARIEGREPVRTAVGVLTALGAPAGGRMRGRAWREPRPQLVRATVFTLGQAPGRGAAR